MNQYPYHKNLIPIPVSNRTFEYRHPHMGIDESKKEPVMRDHEDPTQDTWQNSSQVIDPSVEEEPFS